MVRSLRDAAVHRFARQHGFDDWQHLHDWSITDLDRFWSAAAEFLGVRWHDRPTCALADAGLRPQVLEQAPLDTLTDPGKISEIMSDIFLFV